jgi:ABC-type sulfate transport system substrate-binding protein
METSDITTTQKSSHIKIRNEEIAHHFLRYKFIPQGQTVIQAFYTEILKRLHETVLRKIHELWPNNWILHHDNASANKTPCQAVSGPKIDYGNVTPTLSPSFGSE